MDPLSLDEIEWNSDLQATETHAPEPADDGGLLVGQERALTALEFGLQMPDEGYNLFVLGREGLGRREILKSVLEREAAKGQTPLDWCYCSNFSSHREPRAVSLAPGLGVVFRDRMLKFVNDLNDTLKSTFQGTEYRTQREVIDEEFKEKQEQIIQDMEEAAGQRGLVLMRTPMGFTFAPVKDGKVISQEVFQAMAQDERDTITKNIREMESALQQALRQVPSWAQEAREKVEQLNRRTAAYATDFLVDAVKQEFRDHDEIQTYLDELAQDILKHIELIISIPQTQAAGPQDELLDGHPFFRRYLINLFVDHKDDNKAPIVFEDEPTFERLLGAVEHRAEMGMLETDLHLIRAGALHRANGGYLVLDARKVLMRPLAWDALKRALFARKVQIESMARTLGLMTTISLEPEPIPINLKTILIGDRLTYTILDMYDPEFSQLFKVAVDFEEDVKSKGDSGKDYASVLKRMIESEELPGFEPRALERVLRFAAREAGHREKLTLQMEWVRDLLRESAFFAQKNGSGGQVSGDDVKLAIAARRERLGRIPARQREAITQGVISIDTSGSASGQINGLSVVQLGSLAFGRPTRITARVGLGKGEVVDIEREVELGGPIHSKGVLILSSFIRATFGIERPLSLAASLVFEQSYGGVDGDSASVAEACALLSAIAQVPIDQKFAITGAISQAGHVQAIGGVNEKVEGFFDVCVEKGLVPGQGVIIPQSNKQHLVLDERVVDAVRDGRFRIFAVSALSEAIEILTGMPAGERGDDGVFPPDTFFGKVDQRLGAFEATRRRTLQKDSDAAL